MASPSLGDIMTLLSVMQKIVDAIRDSSEASVEYADLIMEIESFCNVLRSVQQVLALPRTYSSPVGQQVAGRIRFEVERVHAMIGTLIGRMVPHHIALNSAAQSTRSSRKGFSLKVVFHRLYWTMFKKEDVSKVQEKLFRHTTQITLHMNTLLLISDAGRDIGPPIAKGDGLEIVDLWGQPAWFNWDLCRNPFWFRDTLTTYLQHKPGLDFLAWFGLGLYEDGGSHLGFRDHYHWCMNWRKVRPGMKVFLSIPQWFAVEGRPEYHPCTRPACGRLLNLEGLPSGSRVDCICGRIYHVHFIENTDRRTRGRAHVHHVLGYTSTYVDYSEQVKTVHLLLENKKTVHLNSLRIALTQEDQQDREFMGILNDYYLRTVGYDEERAKAWGFEHTEPVS